MLVALSGFAQSGKDTAADILVRLRGFEKLAFADALRDFTYAVNPIIDYLPTAQRLLRYAEAIDEFGYEEVKRRWPEAREILQRVGTDAGRRLISDNVWVDAAFKNVRPDSDYVFADCRFPNEADRVRAEGGRVIRIDRPGVGMVNNHISETALLDYRFDFRINNDGDLATLEARLLGYLDSVA